MQLSDILEEHSLKNISKKTNISEDNIDYLLKKKFEKIERVKAMGFISIIEREFKADLATLRSEAKAYYDEHDDSDRGIIVTGMLIEEKRGKSKWLLFIVVVLLAYASWYFVTQFDKSHLNSLLPINEEIDGQVDGMENSSVMDLDIIYTIKQKWKEIVNSGQQKETVTDTGSKTEGAKVSGTAVEVLEPYDDENVSETVVEVVEPHDEENSSNTVEEVMEPVTVDEEKPEETNVARVSEEE